MTWYEHIKILDLVSINAKTSQFGQSPCLLLFEWKAQTSSDDSDQTLRLRHQQLRPYGDQQTDIIIPDCSQEAFNFC